MPTMQHPIFLYLQPPSLHYNGLASGSCVRGVRLLRTESVSLGIPESRVLCRKKEARRAKRSNVADLSLQQRITVALVHWPCFSFQAERLQQSQIGDGGLGLAFLGDIWACNTIRLRLLITDHNFTGCALAGMYHAVV